MSGEVGGGRVVSAGGEMEKLSACFWDETGLLYLLTKNPETLEECGIPVVMNAESVCMNGVKGEKPYVMYDICSFFLFFLCLEGGGGLLCNF